MRRRVEAPLVAAGVVEAGFVDSIALNMYHDGSEGIQVGGRAAAWGPATLGAATHGPLGTLSFLYSGRKRTWLHPL